MILQRDGCWCTLTKGRWNDLPTDSANFILVFSLSLVLSFVLEECEDAIMQGADVNADCGAGMCALHISAIRGWASPSNPG